jgi:hypothetical protein
MCIDVKWMHVHEKEKVFAIKSIANKIKLKRIFCEYENINSLSYSLCPFAQCLEEKSFFESKIRMKKRRILIEKLE